MQQQVHKYSINIPAKEQNHPRKYFPWITFGGDAAGVIDRPQGVTGIIAVTCHNYSVHAAETCRPVASAAIHSEAATIS